MQLSQFIVILTPLCEAAGIGLGYRPNTYVTFWDRDGKSESDRLNRFKPASAPCGSLVELRLQASNRNTMLTSTTAPIDEVVFDADELNCSDPFEGLTDAERAELEQQMAEWQRAELRAAEPAAVQYRNHIRMQYRHSGLDIRDYAAEIGADTPASAEYIANICGFRQATWDEPRNMTRRKVEFERSIKDAGKMARMVTRKQVAAATVPPVETKTESQPTPRICPNCGMINKLLPGAKRCGDCPAENTQTDAAAPRFNIDAAALLNGAVTRGVVNKARAARMLDYYTRIFEGQEPQHAKHAGDAVTVLGLLERSIAAKEGSR